MSRERENIPQADMLMGSMRQMGYSFDAAIADIIDNSISAHCTTIRLLFPTNPMDILALGILDDGIGMDGDTLFEAMRYGSSPSERERDENDLGRFGLGMKSASLSQCRRLTAISIKDGIISAFTWDYSYIQKKKHWITIEHSNEEVRSFPYVNKLLEQNKGTLIIWQDFDVIAKSSGGQVYDTLNELKSSVYDYVSLIFHRYLNGGSQKISIFVNNQQVKAKDPFLENHKKTTTQKERVIALPDSSGIERKIKVKPFILPFATDLKEGDKKLIGGIENLRSKQGFYIYRNNRLIIWGTWFGMKPRAELTKNARIRVDIPNSLDDIWSIDIKKQTASIPKRIQNQLKETVRQTLEISVAQQTHRGRKNKVDDEIDYIWDRMEGRGNSFYYQINRDSKLYQYIRSKMSDSDYDLLELLINEIEKNLPIQQMYIDKSNEAITVEEDDSRFDDVYQIAVTMASTLKKNTNGSIENIIDEIMKSEPFCKFPKLRDKLTDNFKVAND